VLSLPPLPLPLLLVMATTVTMMALMAKLT